MLKVLAIFAIAFFSVPVLAYASPVPTQPDRPSLKVEDKEHVDANVKVTSTPEKDVYDRVAFWANLVLVLVGIGGILVALSTLKKIERQTAATEKQALHMVASERAWIMVEAKFEHGGGLAWGGEETQAIIELSVLNAGPTPAWVYEQWVQLKVSPEVIMSLTQYQSPQFPFIGEGKIAHVNYQIQPVTQGQSPITWKAHIRDKGKPTEENGLNVYIFGVVRYRDAFSSSRETYFGYTVKANKRLERIPNEAYNKHT